MLTNPENTDIGAYEILKKRGFSPDDIAGLAEYLDEHRRKTMQPVLDEINTRFDRMVSKREAWVFITIMIGVAIILPEALEKIVDLVKSLYGVATSPAST